MSTAFEEHETDAAVVAEMAYAGQEPEVLQPGNLYSWVTPAGARVSEVDTEGLLPAPRRKKGTYQVETVEALSAYAREHQDPERTTVWVAEAGDMVTAVFNDNGPTEPGWLDHRAVLSLRLTDEWLHWMRLNGQLVSQEQFARQVEDGLPEIVEPDGADLLELAQHFYATSEASFRSVQRLRDGSVKATYDEEVTASAGATGEMEIPGTFRLAVAPYLGEDTYALTARLRYRLNRGALSIGYQLVRPDDVRREALENIRARLDDELPRVYAGSAP
jgi:uncharacterized protein YfdQ (DUF2303 family)